MFLRKHEMADPNFHNRGYTFAYPLTLDSANVHNHVLGYLLNPFYPDQRASTIFSLHSGRNVFKFSELQQFWSLPKGNRCWWRSHPDCPPLTRLFVWYWHDVHVCVRLSCWCVRSYRACSFYGLKHVEGGWVGGWGVEWTFWRHFAVGVGP